MKIKQSPKEQHIEQLNEQQTMTRVMDSISFLSEKSYTELRQMLMVHANLSDWKSLMKS